MIRLNATSKLQAYLDGAPATTNPQVIVNYSDLTASAYAGAPIASNLNGTTPVDICPAGIGQRDIDHISVFNLDTAGVTVTVLMDVSGTDYVIAKFDLGIGEYAEYTHGSGWRAFAVNGSIKQSVIMDHSSLTGLAGQDHPASAIVFTPAGNIAATDVQAMGEELQSDIDMLEGLADGKINSTGIDCDDSGAYLTTLTYNETTRTVTIAPTGADFCVFVQGVKYTKTAQSLTHLATGTGWFFYFDETGTFVVSSSPWNLLTHAPVAYVFQDVTNNRRICFEERHHAGRDVWWHRNQHVAEGTKVTTAVTASGYTINDGSTDAAVTYGIGTFRLEDEDIRIDTEALPDAGPYTILKRAGAGGAWQVSRTSVLPFLFSGNILRYNLNTAGTWSDANVTEDFFVNYWVFGFTSIPRTDYTPSPTTTQQIVVIAAQTQHSSEALAHSESFANIDWGTIPFQELAPLYQVTMRYNASAPSAFTNTARCAINRFQRIIGTAASLTASAPTDHGSLTGLSDLDHPASAIINTPAGNISATDVQAALNELDTEKLAKTGDTAASLTITSADINGGTIDGTVIGGVAAAAGNFTTLGATGNVTLGDAAADVITIQGRISATGTTANYVAATTLFGNSSSSTNVPAVTHQVGISQSGSNPKFFFNHDYTGAGRSATNIGGLLLARSRGATVDDMTVVNNGDTLGIVIFRGSDGTNFVNSAAIVSLVNGAPAATSVPGALTFNTTAVGSTTFTERVRIDSSGQVGIGLTPTTRNNARLQIVDGIGFPATQVASSDANTLDDYREATFTATATGMTTAPTGTATFVRVGNKVTLEIPTISGTSNAVTFTLTGGPTTMRPSAARVCICRVQDNTGAIAFGLTQIETTGVITLFKDAAGGAFTAAGTKATAACQISYVI
jgi:hypothetical protein